FRCCCSKRAILALCAVGALTGLVGCQGHRVVARVGSAAITADDFYDRVQHTGAAQFTNLPPNTTLDAGALTLMSMIRESLIAQLAAEKKVVPSEDTVMRVISYTKRAQPALQDQITAGRLSEEDLVRSIRLSIEEFGIGTDGAKADPKEVEDTYKKYG